MKDGTILRYMDTSRFFSLLEESALFFPNAASFDDPYEGSIPIKDYEKKILNLYSEFDSPTPFKEKFENLTKVPKVKYPNPKEFIDSQVKAKIEYRDKLLEQYGCKEAKEIWVAQLNSDTHYHYWDRQNIYISCWHENDSESAAMWKLYSNNDYSVCIKSKISSLNKCLNNEAEIERVKYIDYTKDTIPGIDDTIRNAFILHKYKRKSFSHENEVRAMFISMDNLKEKGILKHGNPLVHLGIYKKIDLIKLIDEIIVAPNSPDWYLSLIEKTLVRHGLSKDINVKISSLLSDPVF